ncbi:putative U box domain, armadillo-like helical, Zinc finger, RING/FYVE/PHD-type [Dioscorea sansibarensis]
MAKSEERAAAAARAAGELKKELRRLVLAITDGDDVRSESFEEAAKVLAALTEMKSSGNGNNFGKRSSSSPLSPNEKDHRSEVEIPEHFLCPISSEIMKDPVIVSSGQTYDRVFIQDWLNSGNLTCPKTEQVLSSSTLTPNNLIREMITHWCGEHEIPLPMLENHEGAIITGSERNVIISLLNTISSSSVPEKKKAVKELRLLTKRNPSFRALLGETPEAISQLLSVLAAPGLEEDKEVQEDTVTTILNLSIHEKNKEVVANNPQAIPMLIEALKTGTMVTRSNSAAALFTLSALDTNKIKIGELGAMQPLLDLLEQGSPAGKKDAASAIFNLCMAHENRVRAVKEGAVGIVLKTISNHTLVDESLAILAMLSSNPDVVEEIGELGGVPFLLSILKESSCARNKENALVVLFSICMYDRSKLREVGEEENSNATISHLAHNGTSRARRKAAGILDRLRRTTHITHYSC